MEPAPPRAFRRAPDRTEGVRPGGSRDGMGPVGFPGTKLRTVVGVPPAGPPHPRTLRTRRGPAWPARRRSPAGELWTDSHELGSSDEPWQINPGRSEAMNKFMF